MKILQVINVRWVNATAWFALNQARLLQGAGHEVLALTIPGSPVETEAKAMGLPVAVLPLNSRNPFTLLGLPFSLRRLIRRFSPDLINCHRGESFIFFGLLRRLGGTFALVRTRGDQRLPKANGFNRWLHTKAADAVTAANPALLRAFRRDLGVPKERIALIYGGVDTERFSFDATGRSRVRSEFGYTDQHRVVGLLGRFDRVKGHKEFLQAVGQLVVQGRDNVRILLIGFATATSREQVEAWASEAGVAEITAITGRREDIAACISALDLAVIPSLWSEASARSAMEIMACERPLLASTVGVLPNLLPNRALFDPEDIAAMAGLVERGLFDTGFSQGLVASLNRRMVLLTDQEFLRRSLALFAHARSNAN